MKSREECPRQVEAKEFEIWCDKEADRILLESLKSASNFLEDIANVNVMPSMAEISRNPKYDFLRQIVNYDRADICIFHKRKPILIVEITEHGYTGDNSLQRFARIANSGELGIPFMYFTPFSRTRIDEIEASERATSKRRVSRHLFEGFRRIYDIHAVPIMPFDWIVDKKGLPKTVKLTARAEEKIAIFGELLRSIEHFCCCHALDIEQRKNLSACPQVIERMGLVDELISKIPVRTSDVKASNVPFKTVVDLIYAPEKIAGFVGGGEDYFFKGKDHKLVTLMCLQRSTIGKVQTTEGTMIDKPSKKEDLIKLLPKELSQRESVLYFCGYEKRSEPNGGIVVNLDYCLCRTGKTVKDRRYNLIVIWPRVFFDNGNTVLKSLVEDLKMTANGNATVLSALIKTKSESRGEELSAHKYVKFTKSSIGFWKEDDTIGRIYRSFCDILLLNDALLLGKHWLPTPNRKRSLPKWFSKD